MRSFVASVCVMSSLGIACSSAAGTEPSTNAPPSSESDPDGGRNGDTTEGEADAAPDAVGATSSKGAGGLPCASNETLSGSGREVCVATVGAVQLKIVLPAGGEGPLTLGMYLHGDGAGAHKSSSAVRTLLPWADAKHAMLVSALAPNGCSWWQTPAHDCEGGINHRDVAGENGTAVAAVFEALEKGFDLRLDRTYYYGSSGGSIFLTDQWLPLQGHRHPGVFALMCGGEVSKRTWAWDTSDAALRAKQHLALTYGDEDFLLGDIQAAIADYGTRGFSPVTKVIADSEHCAFDAHAEALTVWNAVP